MSENVISINKKKEAVVVEEETSLFEQEVKKNQESADRLKKERQKANEDVKRQYRLKK